MDHLIYSNSTSGSVLGSLRLKDATGARRGTLINRGTPTRSGRSASLGGSLRVGDGWSGQEECHHEVEVEVQVLNIHLQAEPQISQLDLIPYTLSTWQDTKSSAIVLIRSFFAKNESTLLSHNPEKPWFLSVCQMHPPMDFSRGAGRIQGPRERGALFHRRTGDRRAPPAVPTEIEHQPKKRIGTTAL